MLHTTLPVHPTKRHPLTGQPLRAVWVSPSGRVCWPIMGGAPDPTPEEKAAADAAATAAAAAAEKKAATDDQGNDLGFPKDTPTAEMTDAQRAAYWQHKAHKHEGRVKNLVGDRTPEDVKKDLEELAELKKQQLTPAEQQLTEARDQGKAEATAAERNKAATAIFRGALEAGGVTGDDLNEMVNNFNVAGYITDDGVDTTKITNFAKKFSPGKGTQQERRRDFGGGQRREGASERGSAGRAEAQRRFAKKTTTAGE